MNFQSVGVVEFLLAFNAFKRVGINVKEFYVGLQRRVRQELLLANQAIVHLLPLIHFFELLDLSFDIARKDWHRWRFQNALSIRNLKD